MMNALESIIRYFNLRSDIQPKSRGEIERAAAGNQLSIILLQYLVVVVGIVIQPFFASYQQTGVWAFEGITGRLLFSLIVGIVVLPGVYKNTFDPEKPIFIQLCLLFVAGMGWQNLLATAIGVAAP